MQETRAKGAWILGLTSVAVTRADVASSSRGDRRHGHENAPNEVLRQTAPRIIGVFLEPGHTLNRYIANKMIGLTGKDLFFDHTDPKQGVFLTDMLTGITTRIETYASIGRSGVQGLVAAGTTGRQKVTIITMISNSYRLASYGIEVSDV